MSPYERSLIMESHIRVKYRRLLYFAIAAMCAGIVYSVIMIIDAAI